MRNHLLDPTQVGAFSEPATIDIRATLGIQDTPPGIPGATDPRPEDLERNTQEYRFSAGDSVLVRIFELLAPGTETPAQVVIDERGEIGLPVIGRVAIEGMTPRELELELRDILSRRELLNDAEVMVEPLVRRKWTFSLFGAIGAPNLYPLPSPDFHIIEALNSAGGLIDGATHVYVFRKPPHDTPGSISFAPQIPVYSPVVAEVPPGGQIEEIAIELPADDGPSDDPVHKPSDDPVHKPTDELAGDPVDDDLASDPVDDFDSAVDPAILDPLSMPSDPLTVQTTPDDDDALAQDTMPSGEPGDEQADGGSQDAGDPFEPAGDSESEPAQQVQPADLEPGGPGPGWLFLNQQGWVPDPSAMAGRSEAERGAATAAPPRMFRGDAEPVVDWAQIAAGPPEHRIIELSAEALRNGDPRDNIVIRPGDVIRVFAGIPGEYFMMGQVNRPGGYSLTGRNVTLIQAIAAAGGFSPLAWPQRCTIYRRIGDRRELKPVNLDHIFAGKESDVLLKKGDVILIGSHPAAPFLAVIRNAFRVTYGFGFVYDRNFADIDSFGPQTNPRTLRAFSPSVPGLFQ